MGQEKFGIEVGLFLGLRVRLRQGARLRGRPSAACAGKLAGKLCGQAFKSAFDKCAREELDEINVFVNVFDKVAPEKPVLANAVAVAALNKTRARSLTRSTCSSPTSSTRPEKLDKVQGCVRPPSAACAGKLAGKLCGQAFEFAFDKVRARGT